MGLRLLGCAGLCLLASGLTAAIPASGPATGAPSAPVAAAVAGTQSATHWQAVVGRLGAADYATREAAQRELERATWGDRATLEGLAAAATDEEVQARLRGRLAKMEEQRLVDPPPISLHVKDASLKEVAAALSKATGTALRVSPYGFSNDTWTLDVKDAPFWQVFDALNAQHDLCLESRPEWDISAQQGLHTLSCWYGFAICAASVYRDTRQPNELLHVVVEMYADPRIGVPMHQYRTPLYTAVLDSHGHNLLLPPPEQPPGAVVSSSNSFAAPTDGSKAVTVQGAFHVGVARKVTRNEYDDIEHRTSLGYLKILGLDRKEMALSIAISAYSAPSFTLEDAKGGLLQIQWQPSPDDTHQVGYATKFDNTAIVPPIKAIVISHGNFQEVTVPIELRGLALP